MRYLVSAFACDPVTGSEPYVGWNWCKRISDRFDTTILTRSYSVRLADKNLPNHGLRFIHFDLPFCSYKDHYWKFIKIYYIIWQFFAFFFVLWHHLRQRFNIIHHLTYNVVDMPGWLGFIPGVIFIWGPVGGGQAPPTSLRQVFGMQWWRQVVRRLVKEMTAWNPLVIYSAARANHVFFANRETADRIQHWCRSCSILLETAIDPPTILPTDPDGEREDFVVSWTGNVIPRKALGIAIDAIAQLKVDGTIVRLKVIGDGPLRHEFERYVECLGIEDLVEFVGRVPFSDVTRHLQESHAFVFSSVQDTSGNVVFEAMALGKPIICLDHQGVAMMVDDSCALRVAVNDYDIVVQGFADAIKELASDRERARSLGRNGYQRLLEHHSWAARLDELEKKVQHLTDRQPGRGSR